MIISVINHTNGKISDAELLVVIRAVNRQITQDFEPYWSLGATLRLEGRSEKAPSKLEMLDLRGDAILYLWDKTDVDDALGYHDQNARGIPYGFVFTELSEKLGEPWSVTLSHEALELIADPEVNLLVMGPHPADANKTSFIGTRCLTPCRMRPTRSIASKSRISSCRSTSPAAMNPAEGMISSAPATAARP
jgi:hypothetical protein